MVKGNYAMKKNKLDIINFSKIYDMFGEEAAKQTLDDVNEGRIKESTLDYTIPKQKKNIRNA